jgi:hypothetical protein
MKKTILTLAFGLMMAGAALAQDFKISKSTGTLDIREVGNVTIEGTTGNEIVFSSRSQNRDKDGRAAGLRAISNLGLEDNTGLGLSVVEKGNVYEVNQLKKADGPDVKILVPKGVKVLYSHTSPHGEKLEVKNFDGELEVSTVHNRVMLSNVSGPMLIKTVHGEIDATLNDNLKSPISIKSVHGHVDVAVPVSMKATLKMSTSWGEIFVDPDFKIEIDRTGSGGMVKYSDGLNGKINGGGIEINLSSTHDNVYLRKK